MIRSILPLSPYEAKVAIGHMLKTHRLAANVSQGEVAKRSGVSAATIKRIEASGSASLEHVLMVAFALGLSDFFTDLPVPAPRSIDEVIETHKRRKRASRPRRFVDQPSAGRPPGG